MTAQPTDRFAFARSAFQSRARDREVQRVTDATALYEQGYPAAAVATRVGFPTASAAARYFYRHNHTNLANWFEQERRQAERSARP